MTDKIVLISTCGSAEEAGRIAQELVSQRLAACVNILPGVQSVYRWQGKIENSEEWLLIIKSRRDLVESIHHSLSALHSSEVPELIALPIIDGAPAYLRWVDAELVKEEEDPT
jgi:periplasmic divalent cation tolerance protein